MKFTHPEFLWSLFALAIPILIHLFNFKRYKTLYFSSLKFIQQIDQQTRSTQKLKHLILLLLRLLAITALIFAFAQPYFPVENKASSGGKPVLAIYLDNSFSMTAKGTEGELLSEAREMARKIIQNTSLETRILLNTNKMDGIEQRLVSKVEALELLDKITPVAIIRNLDDVLNWQQAWIDKENATAEKVSTRQFVFLSDFQKSSARFSELQPDKLSFYYPVMLFPQDKSNVYVDSVWFSSPFQKIGQNNALNIRVVNSSEKPVTNLELQADINGVRRDVFLDLSANSATTTTLNYTEKNAGFKIGKIGINDKQLFWDDEFFFSYSVDKNTNICILQGEQANSAVQRVYSLEKQYTVKQIPENSFTLDALENMDLVVLNGLHEIPSGMAQNLLTFAQSGGAIALFPGANCVVESWNSLIQNLDLPSLGKVTTNGTKITSLNDEDPFFYAMFEKRKENINFPTISKAYSVQKSGSSSFFTLLKLQNGDPLFLRSGTNLNCFLFTSSLENTFGSFTSNALFPSILLRIGELSQRKAPLYLTLGEESYFPLYKKQSGEQPVHLRNKEIDFIPKTQTQGLIQAVSLSGPEAIERLKAGTYNLVDDEIQAVLALNYARKESSTSCFTPSEILENLENQGLKNVTFHEIKNGQSLTQIEIDKPFEYWKVCIWIALIALLLEMAVLKLWKK
jgi:hypothetical protein